jgi:two-component system, NtrC family, response regulator HydG
VLKSKNGSAGDSILLVSINPHVSEKIKIVLGAAGYNTTIAENFQAALEILDNRSVDIILVDSDSNDGAIPEFIAESKKIDSRVAIVILTAQNSDAEGIEAVRQGAYDYISKPFLNDELLLSIDRALEYRKMRRELSVLREEIAWKYSFDSLIGNSENMLRLKNLAARIAESDIDILISGEPGTGKELLARAIHFHSARRKNRFVPVQCASIPENLLEAELFGSAEKISPYGFTIRRPMFESADKGTIFLDEISELPPAFQAKILNVMEESIIKPIGAAGTKKIDVRVIASISSDPAKLIAEGKIRNDLYYRLNTAPIVIPPLRERPDDIPDLANYFIKSESDVKQGDETFITAAAMEKLIAHKWPGNVQELENTIKRAMTLCRESKIRTEDILFISPNKSLATFTENTDETSAAQGTLEESLKQRIENTLYANNWNLTRTAVKLGIGRTTLWRKIKKYGLRQTEGVLQETE